MSEPGNLIQMPKFREAGVPEDAGGGVAAAAGAQRQLAPFNMVAEELGPFLVGGGAVFPGGPQRTAPGDERPVGVDDLFGVDGYWRTKVLELSEYPARAWESSRHNPFPSSMRFLDALEEDPLIASPVWRADPASEGMSPETCLVRRPLSEGPKRYSDTAASC